MEKTFHLALVIVSWLIVWAGLCAGGVVGAALITVSSLVSFWQVVLTGMNRDEKFCSVILWCSGCFSSILAFGTASRVVVMLFVVLLASFACVVIDSSAGKSRRGALS